MTNFVHFLCLLLSVNLTSGTNILYFASTLGDSHLLYAERLSQSLQSVSDNHTVNVWATHASSLKLVTLILALLFTGVTVFSLWYIQFTYCMYSTAQVTSKLAGPNSQNLPRCEYIRVFSVILARANSAYNVGHACCVACCDLCIPDAYSILWYTVIFRIVV